MQKPNYGNSIKSQLSFTSKIVNQVPKNYKSITQDEDFV